MVSQLAQHWHLAWMAGVLILIAYLGSPRHRGRRAQERVRRLLKQTLDKRQYHQFHDIYLPTSEGIERLDHLLVSRFGLFVIVSEFRPGEISGGESQMLWKQTRLGRTRRWPNPLHRAKLHAETFRLKLDLPESRIFTLVVIDGQDSLPENLPGRVLTVQKLIPFLKSRTQELLRPEQADRLTRAIDSLQVVQPRRMSTNTIIRLALALMLGLGIYLQFGDDLERFFGNFGEEVEKLASPEKFGNDGLRKSEEQLFEESLMCAYSQDTNRCSCYRQDGEKVNIELEKCRDIAERGSILKQ